MSRKHCPREALRVDSLFSASPGSEFGLQEETLPLSMMKIRALTQLDGQSILLHCAVNPKSNIQQRQGGMIS